MIYRILIFYVGALAVLLSLYPWEKVVTGGSPFVLIFHALDSAAVAHVLNLVVLTAALSVYNSGVYCNSRMLLGLAQRGNAPQGADEGEPPRHSAGCAGRAPRWPPAACVLINYFMPGGAFELLMGLVVSAADHQLGHDQPDSPEVPPRQAPGPPDHALPEPGLSARPTT